MKKQINIRWWTDETDDINPEHQQQLQEDGFNRAHELVQEGYHSGELYSTIDDVNYFGWWEVQDTPDYKLIQLYNVDGEPAGLYMYDRNQHSSDSASTRIESAFIDAKEEEDVFEAADKQLERFGIIRVHTEDANTEII